MIKKYEIITVGANKRIKALRSFHVQGRYVNIGDVGGIVYDENTLSQEGNCWIFSGNLNYPSIRVSGDSIVDTNGYEADVTDPRPFVNITGTSALIGAHDFVTGALLSRELAVADVEQGSATTIGGSTYEGSKAVDANTIRLKSLIYSGKTTGNITVSGEGYEVQVLRYDSDKRLVSSSSWGATAAISGADYIAILIRKTPDAATVPADITAAKVALPALSIEAYLDINDSRIEFQYTGAMTVATKVNLANTTRIDVYKSVIDTSNVVISKTGAGAFVANIFADVVKCNVRFSVISNNSLLIGNFSNVIEIINDGSYSFAVSNAAKNKINVRDCYTFAQSITVLPESVLSVTPTNMPFTFIQCNVPNGRFYHNAKIKNIYTDIDFSKASADLGKVLTGGILVSSEVEGMYRLYRSSVGAIGSLVESYDSISSLEATGATYGTTIYKDAYFSGKFDFAGNNVFGNKVPGHPRAVELKARSRVVQGTLNALTPGSTVTGVTPSSIRVVTPIRYRINSVKGISVKNLPTGIRAQIVVVDERNVIGDTSSTVSTDTDFTTYAMYSYAFVIFSKAEDAAIAPDELGETTITVYNGCKIVNTGTTALSMKGAIRVEDNATLVNASVTGSGYFGGNSVTENANVNGSMLIKDNAVFAPVAEENKSDSYIYLEDRARFLATSRADANTVIMEGGAVFSGRKVSSTVALIMRDNARCEGGISGSGVLTMNGDSHVSVGPLSANGDITVTGGYKQTAARVFYGKRIIGNELEPQYDNNVKTKYDF